LKEIASNIVYMLLKSENSSPP